MKNFVILYQYTENVTLKKIGVFHNRPISQAYYYAFILTY